jgi:hypothetical protein
MPPVESEGIMTDPGTPDLIRPAARELAALAAAARGWDDGELMDAMLAAKNAGWDFERVYREVTRLILIEDATPASLRHAAANPLRKTAKPGPATYEQGAALARELLGHRPGSESAA